MDGPVWTITSSPKGAHGFLTLLMHTKREAGNILDSMLLQVMAVINSRPLVPVSSDPEAPLILTLSMMLTHFNYSSWKLLRYQPIAVSVKEGSGFC